MFVMTEPLTEFHDFGDLFQTLRTLERALIVIRLLRFDAHKKHMCAACRTIWMSNDLLALNVVGDLHGHLPSRVTGGSARASLSHRRLKDRASAGDAITLLLRFSALRTLDDLACK